MQEDKELFAGNSNGPTIKEYVSKYLSYYPLFIISLILCVGAGLVYLRYAIPKYMATTLIFVKNDNKGTSSDLIETAVTGAPLKSNLENEIQLIKSGSLLERVVSKNSFNISYYHVGKIRKTDIYLDAPFRLIPQTIKDSNTFFSIVLTQLNNDGGVIETGSKDKLKKTPFRWNNPFTSAGKTFLLVKRDDLSKEKSEYIATWSPVRQTIGEISSKLNIELFSKRTSIIQLSILIENVNRGKDILNSLAAEYNLSDIEERNIVTQNTIRFIDDRLSAVSEDLSGVEGTLENYQGSKGLVDVNIQSSQSFENSNSLSKEIANNNVKQGVAQSIMNYFNNPVAQDRLVPSTLGLEDPTLAALIGSYNELQLRKQKESPTLATGGIIMKDLNNQLNAVKGSILESLGNITRNLKQNENSLHQQNSQYRQFLSALPRNERAMQEIKRKQSITEGLYMYLLQRREEAAVSGTSTNISNYKQIEPSKGYGPIEPNATNIKLYSALLGLLLPFGIIYLRDVLNDKIRSRKDITNKLDIPIVGEVSHLTKLQSRGVAVMQRDIVGEEFRIMRTNLYFQLQKKEKNVILVTSSVGSEGKSFISLNLAAVLAITGKKVALLEFDMRKPSITSHLKVDRPYGLNEYFSGQINNISEMYYLLDDIIPSLHIFPSGATPTYPGDLFLSEKLPVLLNTLKADYDYVVIDSAPVGLVSDALVLGEYSDSVLFVIRQRYTLRKQLEFVADLSRSGKLKNIGFVFNDVKIGGKIGYYGYGQSRDKKYGYYSASKKNKKTRKKKPELV